MKIYRGNPGLSSNKRDLTLINNIYNLLNNLDRNSHNPLHFCNKGDDYFKNV